MGTTIRPEVSRQNKYHISKHRYYELKHFCLQYPDWKRSYQALNYTIANPAVNDICIRSDRETDMVSKLVETRLYYASKLDLIEKAAFATDPIIGPYILKAVTEGISYEILKVRENVPCGKDAYYELYRRFFWLLHRSRN